MRLARVKFQSNGSAISLFAEHPLSWAGELGHAPEGGSRWNPKKNLSFVPLQPERVVEVRYDYLEGARFRHPPQFVRWRPPATPRH